MQDPYVVVDQFFDGANTMRAEFEAHFREPHKHAPRHQVWNYWYVPELYTYLRTNPAKIMAESLVAAFLQRVNTWAMGTLGLSTERQPWLSVYVDGCGQGLHNDSLNGQMGYVFSITKWDKKNFLGGETLLFRPENYWETGRIKSSGAGNTFYDKVPSRFNQLLVFDDRVIHGVQPIQGTMDPLEGRVVLHGHLTAESGNLTGALSSMGETAVDATSAAMEKIDALTGEQSRLFHGFLTLRLMVRPDGRVASVKRLCDRILPLTADKSGLEPLKAEIERLLSGVVFPSASGTSEMTVPVLVGT
jgi:hypothetical protein